MKKALILAALAFGAYRFFGNGKQASPETIPVTGEEEILPVTSGSMPDLATFFRTYDNKVVIDAKGFYMLVKDGKLYTPKSFETLVAWDKANPNSQVTVGFNAWEAFSPGRHAGEF